MIHSPMTPIETKTSESRRTRSTRTAAPCRAAARAVPRDRCDRAATAGRAASLAATAHRPAAVAARGDASRRSRGQASDRRLGDAVANPDGQDIARLPRLGSTFRRRFLMCASIALVRLEGDAVDRVEQLASG